jgi:uncharacterized protein (DUF2141 family)
MPLTSKELWKESGGNWMLALVATLITLGFLGIYIVDQWPEDFPRSYPRFSDPEEEAEAADPKRPTDIDGRPSLDGSGSTDSVEAALREPSIATFTIAIEGMLSDQGTCRVALYDKEEGFNDITKAALKQDLEIREGKSEWTIPGNPTRPFAVAVFHDENNNGTLDRNGVGIPTERYGFSNDARNTFGPPSFKEAAINISASAPRVLRIQLKGVR